VRRNGTPNTGKPRRSAPEPKVEAKPPNPRHRTGPEKYDAGEFDTRYIKDLARYEAKQEVGQAMPAVQPQTKQQGRS
jgi:hypothetical protein